MAKHFGTQDIDGLRMQWTQMKCDGCGALGDDTAVGHYTGVMSLPPGWVGGIESGVARCYCGECQEDAQMMSNVEVQGCCAALYRAASPGTKGWASRGKLPAAAVPGCSALAVEATPEEKDG